ncbi:phospholipid scramblase-related protein [Streptomyces griseus]
MTTQSNIAAGWFPDPHGAPQLLRYWDGTRWTEHTHPADGQQTSAAPAQQTPNAGGFPAQQQAPGAGGYPAQQAPAGGGYPAQQAPVAAGAPGQPAVSAGSLFDQPVLVVNQKAKLIEVTNEYRVFDQHGATVGSVVQVGQSALRKVLRFVSSIDQYLTHRLEIRDAHGRPQLLLTRPAKFIKSRVIVQRPDGQPVGEIVQQNAIGKINFAMTAGGTQIGAIKAENWRAWNFAIVDHNGAEIARITKTWEGLAKTMFTTADNYVLQIHQRLPEPLLSLVVATALTVDTALKQDARGLG